MEGFDFIGCGEAGSKKDAQSLAARSFCKFLVEQGLLDPSTLPTPLDDDVSPHSIIYYSILYSRKYWRELNLVVEPKIRILADLNLAVRYGIAIRIII